jgi:hypothetical protein
MTRAIVVLAALLVAGPLTAQQRTDPLDLRAGDRVRFGAPFPGDARVGARVVTTGPVYLGFSVDGSPDIVYNRAYVTIDTIDVQVRPPMVAAARSGATLGLFLGTATGIISGTFLASVVGLDTGPSVMLFGGAGSLVGSLTGAATGALLKPGRWYRLVFDHPRETLAVD